MVELQGRGVLLRQTPRVPGRRMVGPEPVMVQALAAALTHLALDIAPGKVLIDRAMGIEPAGLVNTDGLHGSYLHLNIRSVGIWQGLAPLPCVTTSSDS